MKLRTLPKPFANSVKAILTGSIAALAVFSAHTVRANNTWDGGGGATFLWSNNVNWGGDTAPAYGTLIFTGAVGNTNIMDVNFSMNQVQWNGSSAWVLNNSGGSVLSLFDNGGVTQAKLESLGTGGVTINAPVTFAATAGPAWGEINAVSSSITFGSTGTLAVTGAQVAGIRMFGGSGAIATTFNNTVSASGKYFSTSAVGQTLNIGGSFTAANFYLMNTGTLNINTGGNLNGTAVRLGGDFATSGTQNLALGATFNLTPATGGLTFAGVVNSVASNTSGALVVNSQNTSGTNTLSNQIALDSALKITQAAGGTLAITQVKGGDNTTGTDIKGNTLTFTPAATGAINHSGTIYNSAGTGSVTLNGAGTLILSGANTYAGATTITSGTLQLDGSIAAGTALAVGTAGTLSGTGTVGRNATMTGGGIIDFGVGGTITGALGVTGGNWNGTGSVTGLVTSSSGTFTIGTGATLAANGGLTLSGGTLTGDGTVTVAGASTWTGGTMTGAGITSFDGSLAISNGRTLSGRTLNSNAAATLGSGTFTMENGAIFNNSATGALAINNSGSLNVVCNTSGAFNNAGIINKTGAGTVAFYPGIAFNNTGTLNVNEGNFFAEVGGTHSGTFNIANGTSYASGAGAIFNAGTQLLGTGTFVLNGGAVTFNGVSTGNTANFLIGSGVPTFSAGADFATTGSFSMTTDNANVKGEGTSTFGTGSVWSAGSFKDAGVTNFNGTLTITAAGRVIDQRTINNNGSVTAPVGFTIRQGATFNTTATGTFTTANAGTLTLASNGSSATFANAGAFHKTGAGTANFQSGLVFTNSGTVDVTEGTLNAASGYTQTAGSTAIDNGTTLSTTTLTVSGGTLTGAGTLAGSLAYTSGSDSTFGGVISGASKTVTLNNAAATLTFTGANTYTGATTITAGILKVENDGATAFGKITGSSVPGSIAVNNGGTLLLAGTGSADRIGNTTGLTLAGGTLSMQGLGSSSETLGLLTLSANSTLDFGTGDTNTLSFSGLALGGFALTVNHWTGNFYSTGETLDHGPASQDRLLFSSLSLSGAQLAQISFYNDAGAFIGNGTQISFGGTPELAPVPEPTTIFGALVLVGLVGYRERRRLLAAWRR